jgi:hypothetical protein
MGGPELVPFVFPTLGHSLATCTTSKNSQKLRYILRNPVKRGLCEAAQQWRWNCSRHYVEGCNVGVRSDRNGRHATDVLRLWENKTDPPRKSGRDVQEVSSVCTAPSVAPKQVLPSRWPAVALASEQRNALNSFAGSHYVKAGRCIGVPSQIHKLDVKQSV